MENVFFQLTYAVWLSPLMTLANYMYLLRRFYAWMIDPESTNLTQEEYNKLYEGSEFDGASKYALMLNYWIVTVIYMSVFPMAIVVAVIALFINYWADKFCLLRYSVQPYVQGPYLARAALLLVRIFSTLSPGLAMLFLPPSINRSSWPVMSAIAIAGIVVGLVFFFFVPLSFQQTYLGAFFLQPVVDTTADAFESLDSYYVAQYRFAFKYHRSHPVYKILPETICPDILKDALSTESTEGQEPKVDLSDMKLWDVMKKHDADTRSSVHFNQRLQEQIINRLHGRINLSAVSHNVSHVSIDMRSLTSKQKVARRWRKVARMAVAAKRSGAADQWGSFRL